MWLRSSTTSYSGFNLDMDRSPGFGPVYTDLRAFHTRFRFGSVPEVLNLASIHSSPDRSTKSTRSLSLPQFVNTGFQVLFHSPPGVLFTFPSQYYTLSVTEEYLALRSGPRVFAQGSTCLELLRIPPASLAFRLHDSHVLWSVFPVPFC